MVENADRIDGIKWLKRINYYRQLYKLRIDLTQYIIQKMQHAM